MAGIAHTPVMLEEVLSFLEPPRADALMLDCTLGEGGHAEAFLARYPSIRYVGIDADPSIQAKARERLSPFADRVSYRLGYFDDVLAGWGETGLGEPSLALFDLGVSMYHFAESGRGFGHGKDEELDMRLSPDAPRSAAALLAEEREDEIARIIYEYGEERLSRRIAKAIVEARRSGGIRTSGALAELVWNVVPPSYRHGRLHPATRTFQALRIAVNDELGRAERGLRSAVGLLAPGGLVAVISFHSLEDRIVKNVFRELAGRGGSTHEGSAPISIGEGGAPSPASKPTLELVTKKPALPGADETARNPASRSAKLRVARKVDKDPRNAGDDARKAGGAARGMVA
jgi:16S rRNA (cytosine1402-N4)-methyltransferase